MYDVLLLWLMFFSCSRVSASTLTSLKPPRRKVLTKHKLPRVSFVCYVVASHFSICFNWVVCLC